MLCVFHAQFRQVFRKILSGFLFKERRKIRRVKTDVVAHAFERQTMSKIVVNKLFCLADRFFLGNFFSAGKLLVFPDNLLLQPCEKPVVSQDSSHLAPRLLQIEPLKINVVIFGAELQNFNRLQNAGINQTGVVPVLGKAVLQGIHISQNGSHIHPLLRRNQVFPAFAVNQVGNRHAGVLDVRKMENIPVRATEAIQQRALRFPAGFDDAVQRRVRGSNADGG